MLIAVFLDISFVFSVPSSWAIAQYYRDLEPFVADKVWQISIVIVKTTIIGEKFGIETNKSKNRTISDEVRTLNSLLKERSLIGWKFLGDPGWSRLLTELLHAAVLMRN